MKKMNELKDKESDFKALRHANAWSRIKFGPLGKKFKAHTPEEFMEFVKSLYTPPAGERAVRGVSLTVKEKGLLIRFKDRGKIVTETELKTLCEYYELKEDYLRAELKKRKVEILKEKP